MRCRPAGPTALVSRRDSRVISRELTKKSEIMLTYSVDRAREALQFLVESTYAKHHIRKILTTVEKPRALPFKGDAETLNELLIIGRQSRAALTSLLELVEFKRDTKADKARSAMQERRLRERKVIELEAFLHDKKRYNLEERRKVLERQYGVWAREKEQHMNRAEQEYRREFGHEPNWETRNSFIRDFWIQKDFELDSLLEEARKSAGLVKHKARRVVKVEPRLRPGQNTTMRDKLKLAIGKDRR